MVLENVAHRRALRKLYYTILVVHVFTPKKECIKVKSICEGLMAMNTNRKGVDDQCGKFDHTRFLKNG